MFFGGPQTKNKYIPLRLATLLIFNARELFILEFFEKCEGRSNFLGIFNALENLEGGFSKNGTNKHSGALKDKQ